MGTKRSITELDGVKSKNNSVTQRPRFDSPESLDFIRKLHRVTTDIPGSCIERTHASIRTHYFLSPTNGECLRN